MTQGRAAAMAAIPADLEARFWALFEQTQDAVFLVGLALFGAIAFIPLFVQSVMGGTATQAGQVLTPLFLGWVVMSIVGGEFVAPPSVSSSPLHAATIANAAGPQARSKREIPNLSRIRHPLGLSRIPQVVAPGCEGAVRHMP